MGGYSETMCGRGKRHHHHHQRRPKDGGASRIPPIVCPDKDLGRDDDLFVTETENGRNGRPGSLTAEPSRLFHLKTMAHRNGR